MQILTNSSLRQRNTFGIDVRARRLVDYDSVAELQDLIWQRQRQADASPLIHIGRGSNLVLMGDIEGTVLHSRISDIVVTADEGDNIYVRAGAGLAWDEWVAYCLDSGWYGHENLSGIPGEVGAAAVQNSGAYGVEAKDTILYVDAVDLHTAEVRHFCAAELDYGYRHSRLKGDLQGRYAVTHVHFRLSHSFRPCLHYGALADELRRRDIRDYDVTAAMLRQIIMELRADKLPDPARLGNAGSFFKNPVVPRETYDRIAATHPGAPHYDMPGDMVKIPAAWLIEQTGWKGRALGPAAVYERQALVIVNTGGATGADIAALMCRVRDDVEHHFGIRFEAEAQFVGLP